MNKQVIFTPRKSFMSASNAVRLAVKDLGMDRATEIGIEILEIDGIYYTVKNVYKPTQFNIILSTNDASQRFTAAEVMEIPK
jgi:hypothetical protein